MIFISSKTLLKSKDQAKARGEKILLKVRTTKKNTSNPASLRRFRTRKNVQALMKHLNPQFEGQMFMKSLEWVGGDISDLEFCTEILAYARENGEDFEFTTDGFTDILNEGR